MAKKKIIFILLSILLILLIFLVKNNYIVNFDNYIYKLLTKNTNQLLTNFYKTITLFANYQVIILICILSIFFIKEKRISFIIIINSILSATINKILKSIFVRPRPDVLKLIVQNGYSFPSGHAMASMSLYGLLIYLIIKSNINRNKKIVFVTILSFLIILIGFSRIYLGVHYASDIICGYIISVLWMMIYIKLLKKVKQM